LPCAGYSARSRETAASDRHTLAGKPVWSWANARALHPDFNVSSAYSDSSIMRSTRAADPEATARGPTTKRPLSPALWRSQKGERIPQARAEGRASDNLPALSQATSRINITEENPHGSLHVN
jgi:hypothetical protein